MFVGPGDQDRVALQLEFAALVDGLRYAHAVASLSGSGGGLAIGSCRVIKRRARQATVRCASGGMAFALLRGVTLIELIVAMVITALLGAGIGLLVGWVGSWSLLLAAGVGAASALVVGAIALSIAIVMG